jgi:non-homologous end joining protein Ku
MVEPGGAGMVLITLRASEEVRAAAFEKSDAGIDPDMVAIARTIINRRSGRFDPTCRAANRMKRRIASPENVPQTSSVASPPVFPLPH